MAEMPSAAGEIVCFPTQSVTVLGPGVHFPVSSWAQALTYAMVKITA